MTVPSTKIERKEVDTERQDVGVVEVEGETEASGEEKAKPASQQQHGRYMPQARANEQRPPTNDKQERTKPQHQLFSILRLLPTVIIILLLRAVRLRTSCSLEGCWNSPFSRTSSAPCSPCSVLPGTRIDPDILICAFAACDCAHRMMIPVVCCTSLIITCASQTQNDASSSLSSRDPSSTSPHCSPCSQSHSMAARSHSHSGR